MCVVTHIQAGMIQHKHNTTHATQENKQFSTATAAHNTHTVTTIGTLRQVHIMCHVCTDQMHPSFYCGPTRVRGAAWHAFTHVTA